jgi:hypothetical protein
VGLDRARLGQDLAALDLVALDAPQQAADVVAASPWSSSFLNISTPVTTTLRVAWMPTISTSRRP